MKSSAGLHLLREKAMLTGVWLLILLSGCGPVTGRFATHGMPGSGSPLSAQSAHLAPGFYHGGPVMAGPVNVYLIWYGGWSGNTAQAILPAFLRQLGGS